MWEKEITVARQAAKEAGEILNSMFGRVTKVDKKGDIDLVTEADLNRRRSFLISLVGTSLVIVFLRKRLGNTIVFPRGYG